MVEIIFGTLWTIITALCTWGFYGSNGDVEVNGVIVSHEEFITLLWPKLFIGIFWAIGIVFIIIGIMNMIRYFSTVNFSNGNYSKIEKHKIRTFGNSSNYNEIKDGKESDDFDPIKNLN